MKNVILLLMILIWGFSHSQTQSKSDFTFLVGPMIHFNLGNQETHFSFGFEASSWLLNTSFSVPPSADLGVEFEKGKFRIYSELQTGALIGLSAGPVIEFSKEEPRFGFQTSAWAAFLAGVDFRYRRMNRTNFYAPGVFFKLPLNFNNTFSGF